MRQCGLCEENLNEDEYFNVTFTADDGGRCQ